MQGEAGVVTPRSPEDSTTSDNISNDPTHEEDYSYASKNMEPKLMRKRRLSKSSKEKAGSNPKTPNTDQRKK